MKFLLSFFTFLFLFPFYSFAKEGKSKYDVYIWKGVESMKGERVLMQVFVPENANGTCAIICPGGSYHHLGVFTEGYTSARWFNEQGATACVLWYRVAKNNYHYPSQMQDIQRAIQIMRTDAKKYKVNPEKVGLVGYSAGGHLVAWAAEAGDEWNELEKIGIKSSVSLRPDFSVPVYPVVSMQDDIGHKWSRKSLLGKNPNQEEKDRFSLELHASSAMPPIYLVACEDDPVVLFENSKRFSQALEEAKCDFVFAFYPWGGHGFGMKNGAFMKTFKWNQGLKEFLCSHGFLSY